MDCDICGKSEDLFRTVIEDVELSVCQKCSSLGKVLEKISKTPEKPAKKQHIEEQNVPEEEEIIVDNYPEIIKNSRESLGLKQKEFAKKINEKESIVHKIETGSIKPSITMARKLEKTLNIKLIEKYQETHEQQENIKTGELTIGDFIKVKKK